MKWLVCLLLVVGTAGCDSKLGDAAKTFESFAKTGAAPEREDAVDKLPRPKIVVASRRLEAGPPQHLLIELEMPLEVTAEQVARALEEAARGPEGRGQDLVRVRAWPGKLRHLVGPFGEMVLSRSGRALPGREAALNKPVVAEKLGVGFSVDEIQIINALEETWAGGVTGNAAVVAVATRLEIPEKRVREVLEQALNLLPPAPEATAPAKVQ